MANTTLKTRVLHAYYTTSEWSSENPTLYAGEVGYNSTNGLEKVGDGSTAWNSLPYKKQRLIDDTTSVVYKLGVNNGLLYIEEV